MKQEPDGLIKGNRSVHILYVNGDVSLFDSHSYIFNCAKAKTVLDYQVILFVNCIFR